MAKNMPTSGYQDILDQNIMYNNRENFVKPILSPWIQSHVYAPTSNKNL